MFNENKEEYSSKQGKKIPVWQSPKYLESRKKALEIIDSKAYGVSEADFWILMNETKSGKMAYTGLIISHNGCLKINDALPAEKRFRPSCVSLDKEGYNSTLVYSYCCDEQGLFEVGEVNPKNCKIEYPYAMAYKRMFDRVVLKNSKLAYSGIYSEVEADEFRQDYDEPKQPEKVDPPPKKDGPDMKVTVFCQECQKPIIPVPNKNTGEMISEQALINLSLNRFGKQLCADCIKLYSEQDGGDE